MPERTILKKKSKIFPQRGPMKMFEGPTRMFPLALLWFSTGLLDWHRIQ